MYLLRVLTTDPLMSSVRDRVQANVRNRREMIVMNSVIGYLTELMGPVRDRLGPGFG